MCKVAISLACLTCAVRGRQAPERNWLDSGSSEEWSYLAPERKVEETREFTALAALLLALDPAKALRARAGGGLHSQSLSRINMKEDSSSGKSLRVAVAGATGRVGQLVVQQLLKDGHSVKAISRNASKGQEIFSNAENVDLHVLDIGAASEEEFHAAFKETDAAIWCASGFDGGGNSLDIKGMTQLPEVFKHTTKNEVPRIVMLSSAGVSRPVWSDEKKEKLIGASDIPIIRLNPGNILDCKREAEAILRSSDVPYCIVRPTGLKFGDDWPQGRPIFSQGDVAVGRTNAADLAEVLCSALDEPHAVEKTFEMFTLVGYPPASDGIGRALAQLQPDASKAGPHLIDTAVEATYVAMQQLLPGEEQDATKLEMGRTYEQVDRGEVEARQRGAAPTAREVALASGLAPRGSKRQAIKDMWNKVFPGR